MYNYKHLEKLLIKIQLMLEILILSKQENNRSFITLINFKAIIPLVQSSSDLRRE